MSSLALGGANVLGPRDLWGIVGDTFVIYRRNFIHLLAIAGVVQVGLLVLEVTLSQISASFFTALLPIILNFVGYVLMGGAVIHAVSEQSFGRSPDIGRAYRFAGRRLGIMLGAWLLFGLSLGGMIITIIGIPFAVYFSVRWFFVLEVASLEGIGGRAAIRRSSELVSGQWWRVMGMAVIVGLITGVISVVAFAILGVIPYIWGTVAAILSTPLGFIPSILLYYDLRVRKEGYNLDALARELGAEQAPAT